MKLTIETSLAQSPAFSILQRGRLEVLQGETKDRRVQALTLCEALWHVLGIPSYPVESVHWGVRDGRPYPYVILREVDATWELSLFSEDPWRLYLHVACGECHEPTRVIVATPADAAAAHDHPRDVLCADCQTAKGW